MATVPTLPGTKRVLRAGEYSANTHVFAPPAAALLTAGAPGAGGLTTATFAVSYHGFSAEAQAAFQAAVNVWSVTLTSPVPIRVEATWTALGAGILGQAGPANVYRDFPAAKAGTWYGGALASKIAGSDMSPGQPHIVAEFSSSFPNWHFGTGGATPASKYDLMSVVLHELGHGLGFIGSMDVDGTGDGSWGWGTAFPAIYDHFAVNANGERLLNVGLFPNPSTALAGQLQSSRIFFDGAKARAANGTSPVRIYAPMSWEGGSSYSHVDEVTFGPGSSNSLMSPQLGMGESVHAPGSIARGMLADMGW